MKVAVFTPTRLKGGLDVTSLSLKRQTHPVDWWIVADEFFKERAELGQRIGITHHFQVPWREGAVRNACASYVAGVTWARKMGADLFVSLQDYIWLPSDAIERMVRMATMLDGHMLSGLTSISVDPTADEVVDRDGLYTIFKEPYVGPPKEIFWDDVRKHEGQKGYQLRTFIEWEANFSAITPKLMHETDLNWDAEYDMGIAYENQDIALRAARAFGSETWVDLDNHAISLPHKRYFPEIEAREAPLSTVQKEWHEARHGVS